MAQLQKPIVAAFSVLILSTAVISSRYYKSAAFERPFHFSILALLLTGALLQGWSRLILGQTAQYQPLRAPNGHVSSRSKGVTRMSGTLKSLFSTSLPLFMVLCIVARTVIFWRTIRTIHCSWDGLQSFLPFVLSILDLYQTQPGLLPGSGRDSSISSGGAPRALALYPLLALGWGTAATYTYFLTERRTGAICPPGIPERMITFTQFIMTLCDAVIIAYTRRLRRNYEDKSYTWRVLGSVLLASAAMLTILAFWSFFDRTNVRWNVLLASIMVGDLILQTILVAFALVAGIYLLATINPTVIALTVTATTLFVHLQLNILDGTLAEAWSHFPGVGIGLIVFLGVAALLEYSRSSTASTISTSGTPFYKSKICGSALLAFSIIFAQTMVFGPGRIRFGSIGDVIAKSRMESDKWIAGAKQSKSLNEAAQEYSRRHGIPPPPGFDKWYEYAVSVDSPIIDDFTQIHTDLLPYWGIAPALLRERTTHLLDHPSLSFGGLIIQDGQVEVSPHIMGTHRWMMDTMKTMVEPFAQWLPDMQLAFNLDDECRVSVPYDRLDAYRRQGLQSQNRLASQVKHHDFGPSRDLLWSNEFLSFNEDQSKELWDKKSTWFQNWSKSPIFYEWVASTCSGDTPVNRGSWWNRKARCSTCSAPHMTDGVVSNWTLSGDLCHQPDLAYLHGFLLSPSAIMATHTLFPVFSQSRIQNFVDILYPNPWNFGDKVVFNDENSIPWQQKLNSVFWRGASSDGFALHGAWQTFMRARFVHMSQQLKSIFGTTRLDHISQQEPFQHTGDNNPVHMNVSFVGNFARCDDRDCTAENTAFYGSPTAEPPPSLDFQEHWRHRHLVDLDGAAFSGRFLPFLKSASLPYRAALFRTWWEERVHAWRHFVPVDVRLGDLWGIISYFGGRGGAEAEAIAREGSEWANRALRKEDMRVYMFRLLLEWGRVVDDQREELGFTAR